MEIKIIIFYILAAGAVFSAIMMITRRSPISSALFLILNFCIVSGLYLSLKAQFIAIIQVLVYMGAIMVLFLFVIMLLNVQDEHKLSENFTYKKISGILVSLMLMSLLGYTVYYGFRGKMPVMNERAEEIGTATFLGKELFTTYSLHVEIAGMMLLAAVVGAVVLAKKKFE